MKLTMTMRKLLQCAAGNPHSVTHVQSGFITSRKKTQYGMRAHSAAINLAALGLFKHVDTEIVQYHLKHGVDHSHTSMWLITDAGREALK
jgi:hypothetical protein